MKLTRFQVRAVALTDHPSLVAMPLAVTAATSQGSDCNEHPCHVGSQSDAAEEDDEAPLPANEEISNEAPVRAAGNSELQKAACGKRKVAKRHDERVRMRHQRIEDFSLREEWRHI